MMRRFSCLAAALATLALTGCGAVRSAVDTSFHIARHAVELGASSAKHSMTAAKTSVELAKGAIDIAGGAVRLTDQIGDAGHRAKMRDVQYRQAVAQAE